MKKYEFSESELTLFMDRAVLLVREAEEMIRAAMRTSSKPTNLKSSNVSEGHGSAVLTETDAKVENHLISNLQAAFPDHKFIGEETSKESEETCIDGFDNAPTWIIDPIDGTMNFVHKTPIVAVSVALAINKKVVGAIVSSVDTGHLYTAVRGRGAFLNSNTRLEVSHVQALDKAMVLMELPCGANAMKTNAAMNNVKRLVDKCQAVRCPGPAAIDIAWVGAGSADAFFHFGIHCWDMAAGALIVEEAGGVVINPDGTPFDLMGRCILVAATKELADQLVPLLDSYDPGKRDFTEICPI